jgi:hypothetical protein
MRQERRLEIVGLTRVGGAPFCEYGENSGDLEHLRSARLVRNTQMVGFQRTCRGAFLLSFASFLVEFPRAFRRQNANRHENVDPFCSCLAKSITGMTCTLFSGMRRWSGPSSIRPTAEMIENPTALSGVAYEKLSHFPFFSCTHACTESFRRAGHGWHPQTTLSDLLTPVPWVKQPPRTA